VVERAVDEGRFVDRDAVLVRLDCRRLDAQHARLSAVRDGARTRLEAARSQLAATERRLTAHRQRIDALGSDVDAAQAEAAEADREVQRTEKMGQYATESERDRVRTRAERLAQSLRGSRNRLNATKSEASAMQADRAAAEAGVEGAASELEALRAQIRALEVDREECVVRAPRSGYVEELFFEVGELVGAGTPLVRLVDLDEVWVTFYLPNAQLAAVTTGQTAEVRADAYPDRVFSGTVSTVSTEAEFTPRNIQTRDDRTRLVYPIEVRLDNPAGALRPGMPVEVELVGAQDGSP
jgi:HlyD family secretion protein